MGKIINSIDLLQENRGFNSDFHNDMTLGKYGDKLFGKQIPNYDKLWKKHNGELDESIRRAIRKALR